MTCCTPSAALELNPVKSSHWTPFCAGKLKPFCTKVPLTTPASSPEGPTTCHPGKLEPVKKSEKEPAVTTGASKLPLVTRFAWARLGAVTNADAASKAASTPPLDFFIHSLLRSVRRCHDELLGPSPRNESSAIGGHQQ